MKRNDKVKYYKQGHPEEIEYVKVVDGKIDAIWFTQGGIFNKGYWISNHNHDFQLYKNKKRISYGELMLELM